VQLSIIIVNYNVKYFLEHCIISVQAAMLGVAAEIIVVDNVSTDDSVQMMHQKYPHISLIANTENVGFAKANNQAVAIAKGEYILFLNPDTIVPEDCFAKCIVYLKAHPKVGALGARLIDGKGAFLPESKRGFPSFSTAFFKISGLSSLFKKSPVFNKYHLGYLPEHHTNEVDVLVGCFMMMPKKVIDLVGGFSEDYFMYGEDIDLSYCVQKAGFKNVYFADTTVIHYKGESTKKGSLNYVKLFYNAMIIFAKKHLATNKQNLFIPLIRLAIAARAIVSIANKFLKAIWLPMMDAGIMLFCLWQTKNYWTTFIKPDTNYPTTTIAIFFSTYIITWIASLYINGGYDAPLKKLNLFKGMAVGALLTLAVYGLLPETMRFSRGITVIGAASSVVIIWCCKLLLQLLGLDAVKPANQKGQNIITVGNIEQVNEVKNLLQTAGIDKDLIGNISCDDRDSLKNDLGTFANLSSIASTYQASEIIFTYHAISFKSMIEAMQNLGTSYNYKIHALGTDSIIGSNSKNTAGDLYAADWHFNIAKANGKRNKRLFDVISSLIIIITSPIFSWFYASKSILPNAMLVLFGSKTWVGYCENFDSKKLPKIRQSVFEINYFASKNSMNTQQLNMQYARNYDTALDRNLLWKILWQK
jgi:O-antigen biosynthesis protein